MCLLPAAAGGMADAVAAAVIQRFGALNRPLQAKVLWELCDAPPPYLPFDAVSEVLAVFLSSPNAADEWCRAAFRILFTRAGGNGKSSVAASAAPPSLALSDRQRSIRKPFASLIADLRASNPNLGVTNTTTPADSELLAVEDPRITTALARWPTPQPRFAVATCGDADLIYELDPRLDVKSAAGKATASHP